MRAKAERVGGSWCFLALFMTAALNAGCDDGSQHVTFGVAATAEWIEAPATADGVGYKIVTAVLVLQPDEDKPCAPPPSSTRVFINGLRSEGFIYCEGLPSAAIGPVFVEVVP